MTAIAEKGPELTLSAAAATEYQPHRLLTVDSNGDAQYCGTTDEAVGVVNQLVPSADRVRGDTVTAIAINHVGKLRFVSSAAIGVGAQIEKAASGKVAPASAGQKLNWINITAGIDGADQILECLPMQ